MLSVARKTKRYLKEHGISFSFVAQKLGMNAKTYIGMLNGVQRMPADVFARTCEVVGADPKEVLAERGD